VTESQQTDAREQYIEWLRRSATQARPVAEERLAHAWQIARQAAQLLRERYGVPRVWVFGSLLHPGRFHTGSDVDLAVEGLAVEDYWDALADVLFLDDKITIDLIDPDTCPSDIWADVEREGVAL
jgi:predicted nucleotidyltransferase